MARRAAPTKTGRRPVWDGGLLLSRLAALFLAGRLAPVHLGGRLLGGGDRGGHVGNDFSPHGLHLGDAPDNLGQRFRAGAALILDAHVQNNLGQPPQFTHLLDLVLWFIGIGERHE